MAVYVLVVGHEQSPTPVQPGVQQASRSKSISVEKYPGASSSSWEMDSAKFRHRQVRPGLLPTICEYSVFVREEDYQRTLFSSELLKMRRRTRKGYTKLTERFEEDEGPEDEQPLLSSNKDSKPKRSGGWKMPKKGVRILWSRSPRRSRLRSTVKVLSPFLLLRTMRDAYVRVLNTLGGKLNQKAWYSVGARAM